MAHRKQKRRAHRQVRPGTRPGTIVIDSNAPHPTIDVIQYSGEHLIESLDVSATNIPAIREDSVTWVNVTGLGSKEVIEQVAQRFSIHELAVEDVVNTHQRPKMEVFDRQVYLVLRMPQSDYESDVEQISIFLGPNYVLTWQERAGDCLNPIRERLKIANGLIRRHQSDFLAYSLIDAIVDSYFVSISHYSELLDQLDDRLALESSDFSLVRKLHAIRYDVRSLRRYAWAQRDVVAELISYEKDLLSDNTRLHLRDVADHTLRVIELLESLRDSCSDLQDLYMSLVGLRMNEVMKVLTMISTIFIPLSFIAGLYGMNFSTAASPWNMPETLWRYGYPAILLVMSAIAGGMILHFRRLGWIGKPSFPENGKAED